MHSITCRFEFDAAHRILGHQGKCRHLHGHHYVAEITAISGAGLNELDMVLDFAVIKEGVGAWIDRHWDHNVILNHADRLQTVITEGDNGRLPYLMTCNPTAEAMAQFLYYLALQQLPTGAHLGISRVRVYETPRCWTDFVPGP